MEGSNTLWGIMSMGNARPDEIARALAATHGKTQSIRGRGFVLWDDFMVATFARFAHWTLWDVETSGETRQTQPSLGNCALFTRSLLLNHVGKR